MNHTNGFNVMVKPQYQEFVQLLVQLGRQNAGASLCLRVGCAKRTARVTVEKG